MKKKSPVRRTPAVQSISKAAAAPVASVSVKPAEPVVAVVETVSTPAVEPVAAPVPEVVATVVEAETPAFPADAVARLQDASAEAAVDAAARLADLGDVRAVPALVAVLENADGYCHVVTRAASAMALGRLNTPESVAALTAAAGDPMAEVSREAVLALGELKAVAVAGRLTDIAVNASGYYLPTVRHAAVRGLGRMNAVSAKAALERIAADAFEDASIVTAARAALASLATA